MMNLSIENVKVVFIFIILFFNSCVFIEDKKRLEEYEIKKEEAKWFYIKNEYDKAEESYKSALMLAEKMKWIDGIVITKTELGSVYTAKLQFTKAEQTYNEAREICKNNSECSPVFFGHIYDYQITLYLFKMKDISKAERLVEEVIKFQQRISTDESVKERLSRYADYMKTNGFEQQAENLLSRANSM